MAENNVQGTPKFKRTYFCQVDIRNPAVRTEEVNGEIVPVGSASPGKTAVRPNLTLAYPLTLELDVERSTNSSTNKGHFKFYNLGERARSNILHDWWDTGTYRQIVLQAGYESEPQLPIIFQGNLMSAYSYRQKQDWITEVVAFDGMFGMVNGNIALSAPSGYDLKDYLTNVARTMPKVLLGAIGDVGQSNDVRGVCSVGNSWESIKTLIPDSNTFIDNEKIYLLAKNEYLKTDENENNIFLISAETGMLETPRISQTGLEIKMMFEPRIFMGQIVNVQSREKNYNGRWIVNGVSHKGVISGAVGGELTTMINAFRGENSLKGVSIQ